MIARKGVAAFEEHALAAAEVGRVERCVEARGMEYGGFRGATGHTGHRLLRGRHASGLLARETFCAGRIVSADCEPAHGGILPVIGGHGHGVGRVRAGGVEMRSDRTGVRVAIALSRVCSIAPGGCSGRSGIAEVPCVGDILECGRIACER